MKQSIDIQRAKNLGVVFTGCPDCLIRKLDELSRFQSNPCSVCAAVKIPISFSGAGERVECPLHAHARPLLGRALQVLRDQASGNPRIATLCMDIVDALGVKVEGA